MFLEANVLKTFFCLLSLYGPHHFQKLFYLDHSCKIRPAHCMYLSAPTSLQKHVARIIVLISCIGLHKYYSYIVQQCIQRTGKSYLLTYLSHSSLLELCWAYYGCVILIFGSHTLDKRWIILVDRKNDAETEKMLFLLRQTCIHRPMGDQHFFPRGIQQGS